MKERLILTRLPFVWRYSETPNPVEQKVIRELKTNGLSIIHWSALLPWNYIASAFARGGNSLLGDAHLIEKVYFPRLILPLCAVTTPLMDFFFGRLRMWCEGYSG